MSSRTLFARHKNWKNALRLVCAIGGLTTLLYSSICVVDRAAGLEIRSGGGAPAGGFCGPLPHVPRIHASQVRRAALFVLFVFCCCPCCSLDLQLNADPRDCILNRRKPRWTEQNGDAEREGEEV